MSGMSSTLEIQQQNTEQGDVLALIFGLGWAAADEAHLPALPEALVRLLQLQAARIAVVRWNDSVLLEHSYSAPAQRAAATLQLVHEAEAPLGNEYTLRLTIESVTEFTSAQLEMLNRALQLIQAALECILIGQRDRAALGEPYAQLSEREWQICQALERADSEKQIAELFDWSRHTLHSYVKTLYRKLRVQSRLQLLGDLKSAREDLRRRTLIGRQPGKMPRQQNIQTFLER